MPGITARPEDGPIKGARLRELPSGDGLAALIAGLQNSAARAVARQGGCPVPPLPHDDDALMTLCSEILHLARRLNALRAERYGAVRPGVIGVLIETLERIRADENAIKTELRTALRRVGKIPATTAAGVYAKALAVRCSADGAAILAKSLAEDLMASRELRRLLWPAESL
jgi:hypothetical protein